MTCLATERRRWRPNWARLAIAAEAAAGAPREAPVELRDLGARAGSWMLPTGEKAKDLVIMALLHAMRAYLAQTTIAGRQALAEGLVFWARASQRILDEETSRDDLADAVGYGFGAPRFRRDIDG